jgi:hypothetical protein
VICNYPTNRERYLKNPKRVIASSWPNNDVKAPAAPQTTTTQSKAHPQTTEQLRSPPRYPNNPSSFRTNQRSNGFTNPWSRNATIGRPAHDHSLRHAPHISVLEQIPRHRSARSTCEEACRCFQRRVSLLLSDWRWVAPNSKFWLLSDELRCWLPKRMELPPDAVLMRTCEWQTLRFPPRNGGCRCRNVLLRARRISRLKRALDRRYLRTSSRILTYSDCRHTHTHSITQNLQATVQRIESYVRVLEDKVETASKK